MKQINFRKIDALLIKLSLNGKFWLLCTMVTLLSATVALTNYHHSKQFIESTSLARAQSSIDAYANIANAEQLTGSSLSKFAQKAGIEVSNALSTSRRGDMLLVSAQVGSSALSQQV
ncbi:methyl-accepting chemotaxis protein, partial [Shewanella sp. 0m-11]